MDSVRYIVASAVLRGWSLHQFDSVTAFLHGDIDTDIYMELPEGFQEEGYVCRLRRFGRQLGVSHHHSLNNTQAPCLKLCVARQLEKLGAGKTVETIALVDRMVQQILVDTCFSQES